MSGDASAGAGGPFQVDPTRRDWTLRLAGRDVAAEQLALALEGPDLAVAALLAAAHRAAALAASSSPTPAMVSRAEVVWTADPAAVAAERNTAALVLMARRRTAPPADGLSPAADDLIADPMSSAALIVSGSSAGASLDRWSESVAAWLIDGGAGPMPGPGAALGASDATVAPPWLATADNADEWADLDAEPSGLLFERWSPRSPWTSDPTDPHARVVVGRIGGESLERWAATIDPSDAAIAVTLPDGLPLDPAIRVAHRKALGRWLAGHDRPPDPDADGLAAYYDWLAAPDPRSGITRHTDGVLALRPDIAELAERRGTDFLDAWIAGPGSAELGLNGRAAATHPVTRPTAPPPVPASGVNVIGFMDAVSGVANAGRRLADAADAAGEEVHRRSWANAPTATDGTGWSSGPGPGDVNLIAVNADLMAPLRLALGDSAFAGRANAALWFWELSTPPPGAADAARWMDEIWAATTFVADSLDGATGCPVDVVPVPLPVHDGARPTRPAGLADRVPADAPYLLVALDLLSVMERKNPLGALAAFRKAVPRGSGPRLVIKTINGERRPGALAELTAATADEPDVVVWDELVPAADMVGLVAHAAGLVSLHRSEGLGLHLADAVGHGVPVISTAATGPMDFLIRDGAHLIPAAEIAVGPGHDPYPTDATWWDPDLDAAAAAIRATLDDHHDAVDRARKGRAHLAAHFSTSSVAPLMAARLAHLRSLPTRRSRRTRA